MFLPTKIAALAFSAVALAGGALSLAAFDKTVTLTVDGKSQQVTSLASTVQDVLSNSGIQLNDRDIVFPSPTTEVRTGDQISVQFARRVVAVVDGVPEEFYTTANTVQAALAQVSEHNLSTARMSVSRSAEVGRDGIEFTVTTPKQVTLVVGGKKTTLTTTAATVAELLTERSVTLHLDDKLSNGLAAPVTEGMKVTVKRVSVEVVSKNEPVAIPVVKKKTKTLWLGESRLLSAGKAGKAVVTYEITTTDGKDATKVILRMVTLPPKPQVILVGTKTTGNGAGINLARASMWDRIARCESGGNWHINTGNGYYGGLQFNLASWRANGGRDFAARPDLASRAQQITVANRYYAKAGTSPWSCA